MSNPAEKINSTITATEENWQYVHLPHFAKFIRGQHLVAFTQEQLRLCKEVDLPLLRQLAYMSEEELLEKSIAGQEDLLLHMENNTLKQRMENEYRKWETDNLEVITQNQLVPEDLVLGTYVRKQAFTHFLPMYTSDMGQLMEILREIDDSERRILLMGTNTHARILQQQIAKHEHFIESVTNTLPGALTVYNITDGELLYHNDGFENLLGYSREDLEAMKSNIFKLMVHPEDMQIVQDAFAKITSSAPGQVITFENRAKLKNGEYSWVRSYMSLFNDDKVNAPARVTSFITNIEEEKQAMHRLANSEKQLLEAQELANIGSYVQDIETDITEVTPQFLKIYEIEDTKDMHFVRERIHPADRERVALAKQEAIDNNTVFDSEFRYVINGREKIIWARGIVTENNGRQYLRGTIMDVSEKKHMLLKLQRSEILHKQAQLMSHIGNWAWNLSQDRLEMSDEMYRIFGVNQDADMHFDTMMAMIHPDDRQKIKDEVLAAAKSGAPVDVQYKIKTPSNIEKVLHTKGQVLLDDNNTPFKMFGTTQDVTKEYEINKQLKESRELSKKITDTTPSLIALFNVKTMKFAFVNKSFETSLGYDVDTVYTGGIDFVRNIIHNEDRAALATQVATQIRLLQKAPQATDAEAIPEFIFRIMCADGMYRWVHTYGTVFERDAKGNIESVLIVSVDITPQVEAEQQLKHQNVQLQQSNKHLEEFAYIASHDLKEPLRKISTFGGRLASLYAAQIDEEGKLYIEKIISSVQRMQTMIDDLMALSTIGGDKIFAPCDLSAILDETLVTLEYKIQKADAQITSDKLPVITAIPSQFRQLFQNLLSNAIKFAHRDRSPHIRIKLSKPGTAVLKQHQLPQQKSYIQLDFTDNGIGFEKDYAEKIFKTFQRLHGKSQYEGNGIGLAICRKVVENHQGVIFATSEYGEGSTFSVILPVQQ